MEPVSRKEPVSERRDDTSTDDDQDESYPVHSVLAIEPIIYLERCRRLRAPQGDQDGNHNLYERPESQARPKTTNHGGRIARAGTPSRSPYPRSFERCSRNGSRNSPCSCCPTRTLRSLRIVPTIIDTPTNTPPVNWRPWVTRTWRTTPMANRVRW